MPEPTPEQLGREAGEAIANAIADNLEAVIMRLADSIAKVQAEQAKLRDAVFALDDRVRRLEQPRPAPTVHLPAPGWGSSGR